MTLNYVLLTLDQYDGRGNPLAFGFGQLAPTAQLVDTTDHQVIGTTPVIVPFAGLDVTSPPVVKLVATDNANLSPSGWAWTYTPPAGSGVAAFSFFLPYASGASQYLSAQTPVVPAGPVYPYLLTAGGTMTGPLILGPGTSAGALQGGASTTSENFDIVISSAGRPLFLTTSSQYDHSLTTYLQGQQTAGGGGSYNPTQFNNCAVNAVSENYSNSAMFLTGVETAHGTLKVTHKGYANGADSVAAALSVDLQTDYASPGSTAQPGGLTGTAAQGIFITSTTDSIPGGNAIDVRYNSIDWFVVKGNVGTGNGIVGIGVAVGHVPAGMLEITQKDTTTFGLAMTALASGTDMVNLKDSGGNQRFQVNNSGNLITRATYLNASNMQVGSTSANLGGGGNGVIGISQASTAPSSNPTSNGVVLYVDSTGHLKCLGSSGTVTTLANP